MDPHKPRCFNTDDGLNTGRVDPYGYSNDENATKQQPSIKALSSSQHLLLNSSRALPKVQSETQITDTPISRGSISMPPPAPRALPFPRRTTTGGQKYSLPLAGSLADSDCRTSGMDDSQQSKHNGGSNVAGEPGDRSLQASPTTDNRSSADARSLPHASSSKPGRQGNDLESNRLSFSSLFSMGSNLYSNGATSIPNPSSGTPSVAGSTRSSQVDPTSAPVTATLSPSTGPPRVDTASATTATDTTSVTASGQNSTPNATHPAQATRGTGSKQSDSWDSGSLPRLQDSAPDRRSRSRTQRRPPSGSVGASSSPGSKERQPLPYRPSKYKVGVCALDTKARSKPSRNILTRLQNDGEFEIIVFGDKVILDEAVENWPLCDFLISFFSDGFPLDKAIAYSQLRKPFCVNDLPMQKVLWDRRLCLRILDQLSVPTPRRVEVNRDGGPTLESPELAEHVRRMSGVKLDGPSSGVGGGLPAPQKVEMSSDTDTLMVDGLTLKKPFVEKPVSGEDHNVHIYFPRSMNGGGGRRLFRKIGNKSSEWDPELIVPRSIWDPKSSYVYEQFLDVDNAEDVKAYTVGPNFCHAETRKSPVVDGVVRRNTHGKEIRYITALSAEEATMASKIAEGFGQRICGFDLLRTGNKSYVIDVNGWSFVKDNKEYYDNSALILRQIFFDYVNQRRKRDASKASTRGDTDNSGETVASDTNQHKPVESHRATLKGLFKSPSLRKLRPSSQKDSSTAPSPAASGANTPLISPSQHGMEPTGAHGMSASKSDTLLPPATGEPTSLGGFSDDHEAPLSDAPMPAAKHSWKLKGMVSVIRHADRTPKQKFKFTFHTQPFIDLLKGHQEEVLLKGEAALSSVMNAVKIAMEQGIEDPEKLNLLRTSLARKGAWTGTKVQIKPMFKKQKVEESGGMLTTESAVKSPGMLDEAHDEKIRVNRSDSVNGVTLSRFSAAEDNLIFDKLQLIIKWGGEPTHAARYQSHDLGENMRNDLLLMNRETLRDVRVFTSSERRVSTSAQIWAASFLEQKDIPDSFISVRKDLLDDSNAAKDIMDKVKKKLKVLLREGHEPPPQFAWPANTPEPAVVVRRVTELMKFHRSVMRYNFSKLGSSAAASLSALNKVPESGIVSPPGNGKSVAQAQAVAGIQARWCCGEDAELFKERWEKLFAEFTDPEKVDPSKISELYDTMKFDALHNRQFLEWVFTPSQDFLDNFIASGKAETLLGGLSATSSKDESESNGTDPSAEKPNRDTASAAKGNSSQRASSPNTGRMLFRRKSIPSVNTSNPQDATDGESYFKLFRSGGQSRAKQDALLMMLRELYRYAKILFDFICPQEYGISGDEKLEIGLLTSLPLLREITSDLEEVQASESAKTFIYFTKESHIYTLLNAILEGGVKTKIARNAIPELDYLSQICFELYEAEDKDADTFTYSIRISLSPGCHTADPLDLQLDSKHAIGCAPRRSLTAHADWKEVIGTLRDKFTAVKLPKSFLAINLSDKHAKEAVEGGATEGVMEDDKDPVNLLGHEKEIDESALSGPEREVSVADLEAESETVHKVTTQEADEVSY